MNGTCYCYEGWEGIHCSEDVKECTRYPSICGNNAICQETNGSYTCLCNDGYEKTLEGLCESKCHIVSVSRVIFFSRGPVFVNYQKSAGLLTSSFMGNCINM